MNIKKKTAAKKTVATGDAKVAATMAAADATGEPEAHKPTPEEECEQLRAQLREAEDKFLRAKADHENYRKRMQRELSEAREYVRSITIQEFLTVYDHFQMAMAYVGETPDLPTMKTGMDMILGEFQRTFESLGLTQIDAIGKPFDYNEHEAEFQEPSDTVPAGHVLRQRKSGYRLGGRLVRPASVVVSGGPAENSSSKTADATE